MSNNRFTPALSKSAIKAISMMASRVSFVSTSEIRVTMPNGCELVVNKWTDGVFYVKSVWRGLCWYDLAYDEYALIGLCGKFAGRF